VCDGPGINQLYDESINRAPALAAKSCETRAYHKPFAKSMRDEISHWLQGGIVAFAWLKLLDFTISLNFV
jgi:hypothetical protein